MIAVEKSKKNLLKHVFEHQKFILKTRMTRVAYNLLKHAQSKEKTFINQDDDQFHNYDTRRLQGSCSAIKFDLSKITHLTSRTYNHLPSHY